MDSSVLTLLVTLFIAATAEPLRNVPRLPTPPFTLPAPSESLPRFPPPRPPTKYHRPDLPEHGNHNSQKNPSPPPREKPNMEKEIGLIFAGVAAVLQVCVVAFLLIRRRQLLKSENSF